MNDDMMFEYLLQMGAMQPEQIEMMRKQKQIDALRERSMDMPQGQMISKHYVAPSITQHAANALGGYMAGKQQKELDTKMSNPNYDTNKPEGPNNMPGLNQRQRQLLEDLRKRRQGGGYGSTATLMLPGNGPTLDDMPGY